MATGVLAFAGATSALIFKAILDSDPPPAIRFNRDLPPKLEDIINRTLEKDRELRYQHASEMRAELQRLKRDTETGRVRAASSGTVPAAQEAGSGTDHVATAASAVPPSEARRSGSTSAVQTPSAAAVELRSTGQPRAAVPTWLVVVAALVVVVAIAGGFYYRSYLSNQPKPLTDKDSVVLADFTNTISDSVFDGTLRQGLSAQLEQSPFLNLLSDQQIGKTLALMSQPKDARLTSELEREVCQRTSSAAISSLGSAYALSGDRQKAGAAYQDFLALWKDADADIPIYKRAKAEYAKLQ
jgi:eukaryotic-like serine/threonine-protein kinase